MSTRRPPMPLQQSSAGSRLLSHQHSFGSNDSNGRRVSDGSQQSSSTHHNPFSDPVMYSSVPSKRGISSKFSLHPDPSMWGYDVSPRAIEEDDWLHKPDKHLDETGSVFTGRGFTTVGFMILLALGLVGLFLGYPVTVAILDKAMSNNGAFNMGGINATGQISQTVFSLIDKDTPQEFHTKASPVDGRTMQLVFSDEFETEGRSFYPGDDPFWEAADLYYWGTKDLEWYDPQQVTTRDGKLVFTFKEERNHDLDYMGGMITSWNKFCFTGGLIEASVQLPGDSQTSGFWPAVWTMGNLGRAGYGASTDGMWPYSYEKCDLGTLKNQTLNGVPAAQENLLGDQAYDYSLSYLPGQRLSACTCPGELHPGPVNPDGTFRARSAPEIDVIEAQVDVNRETGIASGGVSQSGQFAPFNAYYSWDNATNIEFHDPTRQELNGFKGNVYQQAASVVSRTNQQCYEYSAQPCFAVYGFQYKPGYQEDNAHITWINDDRLAWTIHAAGVGADPIAQISERVIPNEPMYIIMNLGMSPGFSTIDFDNLRLPAHMSVDYIRIYQYPDEINYGCDPPNFPTSSYIDRFIEAYTNPNLTIWTGAAEVGGYGQPFPKNSLIDTC